MNFSVTSTMLAVKIYDYAFYINDVYTILGTLLSGKAQASSPFNRESLVCSPAGNRWTIVSAWVSTREVLSRHHHVW